MSKVLVCFFLGLVLTGRLTAQGEPVKNKLSLEDAVKNVIENNLTVKNAKLEIAKTISPVEKNNSPFTWKVYGDVTATQITNPLNQNNIFSGTKISNNKIAVGIEKDFRTGTYFATEVSSIRFDSNAFEGTLGQVLGFSNLALPPLYTGALSIKLSQELWKHSFGKVEKNKEKILQTRAEIERENLVLLLSNVVAKVLVDYWTLAVQEASVQSYEKLVKNAKYILGITYQKQKIGIAENFEASLWNSVVNNLEGNYQKLKLQKDASIINLSRILGVDPKTTQISGVTELKTEIPAGISYEKDLEYALQKRIELRNIKRSRALEKLNLENAEEEDSPSIKVTASYNTIGQNLMSPQDNYFNPNQGILSLRYPEKRLDLTVKYPLGDVGIAASIKDSKASLEKLKTGEADLIREISVELQDRIDAIYSSHKNLQIAEKNLLENQRYYNGVVQRFAQGKYTANAVKTALDNLAISDLQLIQSKVNFNINLLRYEISKNSLFENYGIDPDQIIQEILKKANEPR